MHIKVKYIVYMWVGSELYCGMYLYIYQCKYMPMPLFMHLPFIASIFVIYTSMNIDAQEKACPAFRML